MAEPRAELVAEQPAEVDVQAAVFQVEELVAEVDALARLPAAGAVGVAERPAGTVDASERELPPQGAAAVVTVIRT
jgi:hypothetical protein